MLLDLPANSSVRAGALKSPQYPTIVRGPLPTVAKPGRWSQGPAEGGQV